MNERLHCGLCGQVINGVTGLDEARNMQAHLAEHHDRSLTMEEVLDIRLIWESEKRRSAMVSKVRPALDELLRRYPGFDIVSIDWQVGDPSGWLDGKVQVHTGPWVLVLLGQPSNGFAMTPAWAVQPFAIFKTTGALYTLERNPAFSSGWGAVSDDPIWEPPSEKDRFHSRLRLAIDELLRRYPTADVDILYDLPASDWTPESPSWIDTDYAYVEIDDFSSGDGVNHQFAIMKDTGAIFKVESAAGPISGYPIWTP